MSIDCMMVMLLSAGTPFPGAYAHLAAVRFGSFTNDHTYIQDEHSFISHF